MGSAVCTARTRSLDQSAGRPSLATAAAASSAWRRPRAVSGVGPWPPKRLPSLPSLCPWRSSRISATAAVIDRDIYARRRGFEMPNYARLHELVSHRVTFEYDTGAKIVGYIAACKPATGPVQVVVMSRVDILDDKGRVLEHHDEFSFVPNVLSSFRLTEGPS